jgi:transposase
MLFVGADVHRRVYTLCILDDRGKKLKEARIRGGCDAFLGELEKLRRPFAICYEASFSYGHLHDRLRKTRHCRQVLVAHPGHLRLIFRSKKKNDRVDAEKLAKLLFLGEVPPVHVPSLEVRDWRALIEFRRRLIDKRTRVKNALRSILATHGIDAPYGKGLWTRKGLAWLKDEVELPTRSADLRRELLLDELQDLTRKVRKVQRELNAIGRKHPGVVLLQTIPGVGPRTAEAIVAYIDDVKRFASSKQVGSYFGLVPCQDQSADKNRLGHITREGPPTARKMLTESAWQGIRHSPEIRAFFERIVGDDPDRRKIALIATAHWLVRVMFAMLRTGEACRFTKVERRKKAKTPVAAESSAATQERALSSTAA